MIFDDSDGQRMGGAYVFPTFVLQLRKTPEKPQQGKLTRPGIEPGPARRETTMLFLDHSGGRGQ